METKDLIKLLKHNKSNKYSTGFTLIELVIASFISVVVIGAAGFGLMAMLRGNKAATIGADRRTEVNRALEFISDEIRKAETIETNPTTAFNNAVNDVGFAYNFDPTQGEANAKDNAQPILALNIPNVAAPVLYYISPPESTAWQGPRVIYRLGPSYNNDGSYSNASDPTGWVVEPLVDRIDNDSIGALSASCGGGFTASTGAAIQGFYACVEDTGKTAKIFAVGQLENGDTYQADNSVYARATKETLVGTNNDDSYKDYTCKISAGSITCTDPDNPGNSNIKVKTQVIGSLMGCNSLGAKCDITTTFNVDENGTEITKHTISPNDFSEGSFTIEENKAFNVVVDPDPPTPAFDSGDQNNTDPISSLTNTSQVVFLKDGDSIPSILQGKPAWNPENNSSVFDTLNVLLDTTTNSTNSKPFIEKGKVNLDENQYILAFEIGQDDTSVPGYDLQDQVILITIEEETSTP